MADATSHEGDISLRPALRHPGFLCGVLLTLACMLALRQLNALLPARDWISTLLHPGSGSLRDVLIEQAWLPRIVVAWLGGAALGLSGAVFQQALRNPLAEPATLGTAAGAQLALVATGLWAPAFIAHGREGVALAGAAAATALVFALASRRGFSSLALILAGMIVTLTCGAAVTSLTLLNDSYLNLAALSIWGGGSLDLQGWETVSAIAPRLLVGASVIFLAVRPLSLLDLDDAGARGVGAGVAATRILAMIVAIGLTAAVVSSLGVIGFIGLASPMLATLAGARRFASRLIWAPAIGAALLWLTDQLVQLAGDYVSSVIPAGVMAALLGAPLLLWRAARLRDRRIEVDHTPTSRAEPSAALAFAGIALLILAIILALAVGRGPEGWRVSNFDEFYALLPWRAPRATAALAAGAMLALSGALTQRLTGNPMASPEVLGVSAGAALGLVALLAFQPGAGGFERIAVSSAGALASLALTLVMARGGDGRGDRVLVIGVAASALLSAALTLTIAGGSLQSAMLLNWMAGSTYGTSAAAAGAALAMALCLLAAVPLWRRWLEILPLEAPVSRALGLDPGRAGGMVLLAAGVAAAGGTLTLGPLSFVGLMAPHAMRLCGVRRIVPFLLGSALSGAVITVTADWAGRNLMFPYEMPAGLITTLCGGPVFMWLLIRGQSAGRIA